MSIAAFREGDLPVIHSTEGNGDPSSPNELSSLWQETNLKGVTNSSNRLAGEEARKGILTQETIENSLSALGHNYLGQIVFSCSNLTGLGLRSISRLSSYTFLQKVNLDNNQLTSLEALEALPYLVFLSASHNMLTDSCFNSLRGCSSNLEHLQLNHNRLTSLHGLHHFPFLINFSASSNAITELHAENFSTHQCLMRVQLRKNQISHVDPQAFAGAQHIRSLDLSHNHVENMLFISYITENLEALYMAGNNLTRIDHSLSQCPTVVVLDFRDNRISSISDLQHVCPAPALRKLYVTGNPFREIDKQEDVDDRNSGVASSEITIDDLPYSPVDYERVKQRAVPETETSSSAVCPTLPYVALSTHNTYGRIKDVVAAANKFHLTAKADKMSELRRLPLAAQARLRILSFLPHLTVLNGILVTSEEVARAAAYFEGSKQ